MNSETKDKDKKEGTKLNFKLRNMMMSKYDDDKKDFPHTHHFVELFYVTGGKGMLVIEDDNIPVKANDLIIMNPYVEHFVQTDSDNAVEFIAFGIDGLAFAFGNATSEKPKNYSYRNYSSMQNYWIDFSQLMQKEFRKKSPGYEVICHSLLQVLLIFICREQQLSIISNTALKISKECTLAKRYIDSNYSQPINLDLLAKITHINKYYLAHSFTSCLGQSPISYLTDRRLQASMDLLINSSISIAQIAEKTGFTSQSYFSQIFKKEIGMTPQQYRKMHTSNTKKVKQA